MSRKVLCCFGALAIMLAACHPIEPGDSPETIITKVFHENGPTAIAVARCESSLNPLARSGPNYGLFQINAVHADQWAQVMGVSFWSTWADATTNTRFAHWLFEQEGWGSWACRPR